MTRPATVAEARAAHDERIDRILARRRRRIISEDVADEEIGWSYDQLKEDFVRLEMGDAAYDAPPF